MNHLIVKIRGKNGGFLKVLSGKSVFSLPKDLNNPKAYEADYKLEDDQWFAIEKFSEKDYCIDLLKKRFISTEYNQITNKDYQSIEYLCSAQSGKYYFQKISPSQLIKKTWLSISKNPKLIQDERIIVINHIPDAIYIKDKDTLYFKKLNSIASIFKGIEILYREATKEETESFLKSDFIKLGNDYSADSVKSTNRKRIAMAIEALNKFPESERKNVFSYIQEYCKKVKFENNSFNIGTEEDLKQVLYGINQRYYTTPFGKEKRLANSVTKLE
jgi:hypothetical protein